MQRQTSHGAPTPRGAAAVSPADAATNHVAEPTVDGPSHRIVGPPADGETPHRHGPVVLTAKLTAPPQRQRTVRRPRLLDRLSVPDLPKLTLVDAPAGWGKTTVLEDWCAHSGDRRAVAWVSLDVDDNDPVRFWSYCIEALVRARPDLRTTTARMFGIRGIDARRDVLPRLLRDVAELRGEVLLILDDYHAIATREIHDGVTFVLDHLPRQLRLAIATRSDPPLPLPRLRVRGELTELRAADLRFTEDETSELLQDVLDLRLRDEDVAQLHRRTEGWAAGLYLAALSVRGRSDSAAFVAAFAGDDRHVVDYLGAEVLADLPARVQTFLARTSILRRMCGPLCDAVTGGSDGAAMLAEVEHGNLFVVALDTTRTWYRYHHLFGQLLQHELALAEPQMVATLHRRAASWLGEHDAIPEAIAHARSSGDDDLVRELIARHWTRFFNHGRLATVTAWLDSLPHDAVTADPRLCLARAWISLDLGELDAVDLWLTAAERSDDESVRSWTTLLRALHSFKSGAVTTARDAAQTALALREPDDVGFWRSAAGCIAGVTLHWSGDAAAALATLERTALEALEHDNTLAHVYVSGYVAALHVELGDLDAADRVIAAATAAIGGQPEVAEHFVTMALQYGRAELELARGRPEAAAEAADRAVELARRGGGVLEIAGMLLLAARTRRLAGGRDGALGLLEEARSLVDGCADPGMVRDRMRRTRRQLRAGPTSPPDGAPVTIEVLSDRELAVLRMLSTDLSQREIASALYVSLNTVKTHARAIYRKLGVNSRSAAVASARALGLL